MRSKFPLLEAMRAARVQREAEITAPLKNELLAIGRALQIAHRELHALTEKYQALQSVVTADFGERIFEDMRRNASRSLYPEIMKLLGSPIGGVATASISKETLRFMRPDEAERHILDRAKQEISARVRVSARLDRQQHATFVRLTIPQFNIEMAVNEELTSPRTATVGRVKR